MNRTIKDMLIEEFIKESDQAYRAGARATFEALDLSLRDWRVQLLIRIAPRWFINQTRSRVDTKLRSSTSEKD